MLDPSPEHFEHQPGCTNVFISHHPAGALDGVALTEQIAGFLGCHRSGVQRLCSLDETSGSLRDLFDEHLLQLWVVAPTHMGTSGRDALP